MLKSYVGVEQVCPYCEAVLALDSYSKDLEKEVTPTPGDIGVCFKCKGVLIYDESLTRVLPTKEQALSWPEELKDQIRKAIGNMDEFYKKLDEAHKHRIY